MAKVTPKGGLRHLKTTQDCSALKLGLHSARLVYLPQVTQLLLPHVLRGQHKYNNDFSFCVIFESLWAALIIITMIILNIFISI